MNKGVSEMDKVTQQNAANAEETSSASEQMKAQAEKMKEVVDALLSLVGGTKVDSTSASIAMNKTAKNEPESPGKKQNRQTPVQDHDDQLNPAQLIPFDDDDFQDF